MRIDIATLFPELFEAVLGQSIVGRACRAGHLDIYCHQIRDYSLNKHRNVDDTPYGGGRGMLMQAEPIYRCLQGIEAFAASKPHVIYTTPKGRVLTQQRAAELAAMPHLCVLCGHYEGVDQRLIDAVVDEELSVGDYVLTGGELPALILCDCVARLCPGVLKEEVCWQEESHGQDGLLEYPHYTKPEHWRGRSAPPVLLSGHHANILRWRREQSLLTTARQRPELLERAALSKADRAFLAGTLGPEPGPGIKALRKKRRGMCKKRGNRSW